MIGVFDSGVGGLFALRTLRACLPTADLIYFGDTRNLPYGGREAWELLALARRAVHALCARGARAVLAACGTASSIALPVLRRELDLPLYGILEPTADAAARAWRGGGILLLGTQATVRAGLLCEMIKGRCRGARVHTLPCPAFVGMAERGEVDARAVAAPLSLYLRERIDTVVLGCTHFSHLAPQIAAAMPQAAVIDGARCAARQVAAELPHALTRGTGRCIIGTSGAPDCFAAQAEEILGAGSVGGCFSL